METCPLVSPPFDSCRLLLLLLFGFSLDEAWQWLDTCRDLIPDPDQRSWHEETEEILVGRVEARHSISRCCSGRNMSLSIFLKIKFFFSSHKFICCCVVDQLTQGSQIFLFQIKVRKADQCFEFKYLKLFNALNRGVNNNSPISISAMAYATH